MIIGIVCAMLQEYESVKNSIDFSIEYCPSIFRISKSVISDVRIVLIHSGIGKIKAALATQYLILHENVTNVVVIGFAGGLKSDMRIGDIFVATQVIDNSTHIECIGNSNIGRTTFEPSLYTDSQIITKLCDVCGKAPRYNERVAEYIGHVMPVCHQGTLFTSDTLVLDGSTINMTIREKNNILCVDMESFGVYCACDTHSIPCASIRLISDTVNKNSPIDILRTVVYLTEYMRCFTSYLLKEIVK